MTIETSSRPWDAVRPLIGAQAAIFFIVALVLGLLADLDGYEGDDLNSVLPMLNLGAARDGLIGIYRYDWQPLSYATGSLLYEATGLPGLIFLMAPVSIALALALLYGAVSRVARVPVAVFLCLVALTPEILFTGLYYNAAAPAYACATGALATILAPPGRYRPALVGVLLAASVLFRLDFLLVAPALLVLMLLRDGRWTPVVAGLVACGTGLLAIATGLLRVDGMFEIYRASTAEMAERAGDGGWDVYRKIFVSTTIFSPLGWVFYPLGIAWLALTASWRERWQGALIALALLPTLLPVPNLLSVKYLMPLFVLLPLVAALVWRRLHAALAERRAGRWLDGGLIAATLLLFALSVDVDDRAPYLRLSALDARQIGTHDGARSWGAYAAQMMRVYRWRQPNEIERAGARIVEALEANPGLTVVFEGEDSAFGAGAAGWRNAQLMLARRGFEGEVVGPQLIRIDMDASRLWLTEDLTKGPAGMPPNAVVLRASGSAQIEGLDTLP